MAIQLTGLSTTLIGNTIGLSSHDIGTLCTSNLINKWSFNKPIRVNKVTGLSEEDFYGADDGFSFPTFPNSIQLLDSKFAGTALWTYVKPDGPYRIGDFRQYNHSATNPFVFSLSKSSAYTTDSVTLSCQADPNTLRNYNTFSGYTAASLYAGLIITTGNTSSVSTCYYFPLSDSTTTLSDLNWSSITIGASTLSSLFNLLGSRQLYLIPILTNTHYTLNATTFNYLRGEESGTWWCFEGSYLALSISEGSTALDDISITLADCEITNNNPYATITSLSFTITNGGTASQVVNYEETLEGVISSTINTSGSKTIAANDSITISLINDKNYPDGVTVEMVSGDVSLKIKCNISGQSIFQTEEFDLLK